MQKKFSEKIKLIRENLKLSTKEFAESLETSSAHISRIENEKGEISKPLIKLILLTHNISKKWWETGEGPIFLKPKTSPLSEKILIMIEQLPEDERQKIQASIEERYEHYKHHEKCLTLEAEIEELKRLIGDKKSHK